MTRQEEIQQYYDCIIDYYALKQAYNSKNEDGTENPFFYYSSKRHYRSLLEQRGSIKKPILNDVSNKVDDFNNSILFLFSKIMETMKWVHKFKENEINNVKPNSGNRFAIGQSELRFFIDGMGWYIHSIETLAMLEKKYRTANELKDYAVYTINNLFIFLKSNFGFKFEYTPTGEMLVEFREKCIKAIKQSIEIQAMVDKSQDIVKLPESHLINKYPNCLSDNGYVIFEYLKDNKITDVYADWSHYFRLMKEKDFVREGIKNKTLLDLLTNEGIQYGGYNQLKTGTIPKKKKEAFKEVLEILKIVNETTKSSLK